MITCRILWIPVRPAPGGGVPDAAKVQAASEADNRAAAAKTLHLRRCLCMPGNLAVHLSWADLRPCNRSGGRRCFVFAGSVGGDVQAVAAGPAVAVAARPVPGKVHEDVPARWRFAGMESASLPRDHEPR